MDNFQNLFSCIANSCSVTSLIFSSLEVNNTKKASCHVTSECSKAQTLETSSKKSFFLKNMPNCKLHTTLPELLLLNSTFWPIRIKHSAALWYKVVWKPQVYFISPGLGRISESVYYEWACWLSKPQGLKMGLYITIILDLTCLWCQS